MRTNGLTSASDYIEGRGSYEPSEREKQEMFEDQIMEIKEGIQKLTKKIAKIDRKVEEMGSMTDALHESTDKLENLYLNDIEKRKKKFHGALNEPEAV